MKRFNYRKYFMRLVIAIAVIGISDALSACGPVHSYWGIGSEYEWDGGHHHHHKPHKHKKHKKHKKHHHHHHDHDD